MNWPQAVYYSKLGFFTDELADHPKSKAYIFILIFVLYLRNIVCCIVSNSKFPCVWMFPARHIGHQVFPTRGGGEVGGGGCFVVWLVGKRSWRKELLSISINITLLVLFGQILCVVASVSSNSRQKDFHPSSVTLMDSPPWMLTRGGLEICGQRLIFSNGKTKKKLFPFSFWKKKI